MTTCLAFHVFHVSISRTGNFRLPGLIGELRFPNGKIMAERTKSEPDFPSGIIRTPKDIGAWVRRARRASGKTLAEAAALTGVGVRFLHELEHGKETASLGKALLVLHRMGLVLAIRERRAR